MQVEMTRGRDEVSIRIPYSVITCDGGSHRRRDRPNGGLYAFRAGASTCLATLSPRETSVVTLNFRDGNGDGFR